MLCKLGKYYLDFQGYRAMQILQYLHSVCMQPCVIEGIIWSHHHYPSGTVWPYSSIGFHWYWVVGQEVEGIHQEERPMSEVSNITIPVISFPSRSHVSSPGSRGCIPPRLDWSLCRRACMMNENSRQCRMRIETNGGHYWRITID